MSTPQGIKTTEVTSDARIFPLYGNSTYSSIGSRFSVIVMTRMMIFAAVPTTPTSDASETTIQPRASILRVGKDHGRQGIV